MLGATAPYAEAWMPPVSDEDVATLVQMQRDRHAILTELATSGEQILLSHPTAGGDWAALENEEPCKEPGGATGARQFKGYLHAYQAVTENRSSST